MSERELSPGITANGSVVSRVTGVVESARRDWDGRSTLQHLRLLVAYNALNGEGIEPAVDKLLVGPDLVDNYLQSSSSLTAVERTLAGADGGIAANRQLTVMRQTIADEDPPSPPAAANMAPVTTDRRTPEICKPRGGLWTSSMLDNGESPWGIWMEVGTESSSFVGAPRRWRLVLSRSAHRIIELKGARSWVDFALRFGTPGQTYDIVVDWAAVAQHYDAVHINLRCALATQGIAYTTSKGVIAPAYFDTESTFWTRWRFRAVSEERPA